MVICCIGGELGQWMFGRKKSWVIAAAKWGCVGDSHVFEEGNGHCN